MDQQESTSRHYAELANQYDDVWEYSPAFLKWMTGELLARLAVGRGDWILDVGAGTGIYARLLADKTPEVSGVICMDPSQPMLDQVRTGGKLHSFMGTVNDAPRAVAAQGLKNVDAILVKEAVHHFSDIRAGLQTLTSIMAPQGRIVVAMLPPTIEYPLFKSALDLFEARQPHFDDIAAALTDAGLAARVELVSFPLEFSFDHYAFMVQTRYMSLLSEFDDTQIEAGIAEIAQRHGSGTLQFSDTFALVTGIAS